MADACYICGKKEIAGRTPIASRVYNCSWAYLCRKHLRISHEYGLNGDESEWYKTLTGKSIKKMKTDKKE